MNVQLQKQQKIVKLIVLLIMTLGSSACVLLSEIPQFSSQVQGRDNRLQFSTDDKGHVLVNIFSESGIGTAEIAQVAGLEPQSITLRFHLAGLEGLTLAYDDITIYLSISSRGANAVMQEITFTDQERSAARMIRANEPYWLETKVYADNSPNENRIPLKNGAIDIAIPQDFFANHHRPLSIAWIDFYR